MSRTTKKNSFFARPELIIVAVAIVVALVGGIFFAKHHDSKHVSAASAATTSDTTVLSYVPETCDSMVHLSAGGLYVGYGLDCSAKSVWFSLKLNDLPCGVASLAGCQDNLHDFQMQVLSNGAYDIYVTTHNTVFADVKIDFSSTVTDDDLNRINDALKVFDS